MWDREAHPDFRQPEAGRGRVRQGEARCDERIQSSRRAGSAVAGNPIGSAAAAAIQSGKRKKNQGEMSVGCIFCFFFGIFRRAARQIQAPPLLPIHKAISCFAPHALLLLLLLLLHPRSKALRAARHSAKLPIWPTRGRHEGGTGGCSTESPFPALSRHHSSRNNGGPGVENADADHPNPPPHPWPSWNVGP